MTCEIPKRAEQSTRLEVNLTYMCVPNRVQVL